MKQRASIKKPIYLLISYVFLCHPSGLKDA